MEFKIKYAIVIPSYCEDLALPMLLAELSPHLTSADIVIIVDDSPESISRIVNERCEEALRDSECEYYFSNVNSKSGRGAAVRRGMRFAIEKYPSLEYVLECDADGSHQVKDIIKIKDLVDESGLLIGSRYLASSKIVGWPISRRVFSRILNLVIPRMIDVPVKDITNGLRRYSRDAAIKILSYPQTNKGFIYLSEQGLILDRSNFKFSENPIEFVNRTLGKSTVTLDEIFQSLRGSIRLLELKNRYE